MAAKTDRYRPNPVKPQFFSTKPPKADQKALKQLMTENLGDFLLLLESMSAECTFSMKADIENGGWKATLKFPPVKGQKADRLLMARGATPMKAFCLCFYWVQTLPLETMFPPQADEDDGEEW